MNEFRLILIKINLNNDKIKENEFYQIFILDVLNFRIDNFDMIIR